MQKNGEKLPHINIMGENLILKNCKHVLFSAIIVIIIIIIIIVIIIIIINHQRACARGLQ